MSHGELRRLLRSCFYPVILIPVLFGMLSGCDRLPAPPAPPPPAPAAAAPAKAVEETTADEVIVANHDTAVAGQPNGGATTAPAAAATAPPAAGTVIAAFMAKLPHERTDADLAALAALPPSDLKKVTVLDLSSAVAITAEGFKSIEKLGQVVELRLDRWRMPAAGYAPIAKLKSLKTFSAQQSTFDDTAAAFLNGLGTLQELNLRQSAITDNAFVTFGTLKSLQSLDVSENIAITGAGMQHLAMANIGLAELSAANTKFGTAGMRFISRSESLVQLSLDGSGIHDGNIMALKGCTALTTLTLAGNNVTDVGLKSTIGTLKGLVTLNLSNNRGITHRGVKFLLNHKSLKKLYLDGTNLPQAACRELGDEYLTNTSIFAYGTVFGASMETAEAAP